MGAALVRMVVALTAGRPAATSHEVALAEIDDAAADAQAALLRLADIDAAAYEAVVAARRLPRDDEPQRVARQAAVEEATRDATRAPLETARRAAQVLALAERLAPIGNRNAVSDVGVSALLAASALRGAAMNVEINLPYLAADDSLREEARAELDALFATLDERERAIRAAVTERLA